MNLALASTLTGLKRQKLLVWGLLILPVAGGVAAFPLSYVSSTHVLIGMLLFPYAIHFQGSRRFHWLYFTITILFGILAFDYEIKVFYFIALSFYILFILELLEGRLNSILVVLIVLTSPVFEIGAVIIGFPIRMYLSQWACDAMQFFGIPVQADGNLILLNGFNFTVDEACMGLNMLTISMLMGVFIVAHLQKTTGRHLTIRQLSIYFTFLLMLNILSNLFRIILLVIFRILPENPMHDLIGIVCLIIYVMVPLYFIGKWMVRHIGRLYVYKPVSPNPSRDYFLKITSAVLGTAIMLVGFTIDPVRAESETLYASVSLSGMQSDKMPGGITKLSSPDLLIYVKPIPEFFTGEHTPLICWKGSGYNFKKIRKTTVGNQEIYTGQLSKGNEILYTAWWYTNGTIQTIDQFTWRSEMLKGGKRFCLVNVTASEELMEVRLKEIMERMRIEE